jgi:Na+/melibiose symporter-like transporter
MYCNLWPRTQQNTVFKQKVRSNLQKNNQLDVFHNYFILLLTTSNYKVSIHVYYCEDCWSNNTNNCRCFNVVINVLIECYLLAHVNYFSTKVTRTRQILKHETKGNAKQISHGNKSYDMFIKLNWFGIIPKLFS